MTLEEARKIVSECDAYFGTPGLIPEGTNPESVIAIDGTMTLRELEALIVDIANDAPKPVNPFSGKPDQRTHNGFTWKVTQADGSGNNVWEPGVFGWTKV